MWSYLIFNSIIYVIAFISCKVLSNSNRLLCVLLLWELYLSTLDKSLHLLIRVVKKKREHVKSSLWEICTHLLYNIIVCKTFFDSCDPCYPRGAPAPFRFMVWGFPRLLLYIIKGNVSIVVTDDIR